VAAHRSAIDFALVEDLEQSITGGGLEQKQHGCRWRLQPLGRRMTSAAVLTSALLSEGGVSCELEGLSPDALNLNL